MIIKCKNVLYMFYFFYFLVMVVSAILKMTSNGTFNRNSGAVYEIEYFPTI